MNIKIIQNKFILFSLTSLLKAFENFQSYSRKRTIKTVIHVQKL